jgi:hypothetical protein
MEQNRNKLQEGQILYASKARIDPNKGFQVPSTYFKRDKTPTSTRNMHPKTDLVSYML